MTRMWGKAVKHEHRIREAKRKEKEALEKKARNKRARDARRGRWDWYR